MEKEQYKTLIKELHSLEETIKNLEDTKTKVKNELRSVCPHLNIGVFELYFEGNYYNQSYTDYEKYCKDCGATLEEHRTLHEWPK